MSRICIYYLHKPSDRWFVGDHVPRARIRRLLRGPDPIGGVERVYINLCLGLDKLGIDYVKNLPFQELQPDDLVGVVGRGTNCLANYHQRNPILGGIALVTHPSEWPTLFEDLPISRMVVHSPWVREMFDKWYGPRSVEWPVGIDTNHWVPFASGSKEVDFLIYDKVRWDHEAFERILIGPIIKELERRNLKYRLIRYGKYDQRQYREALSQARAMLFLCEHESQGIAYQEAMSTNVPILAWDPGQWMDPWRFSHGETHVPATSVPFFDGRCGATFATPRDFPFTLDRFVEQLNSERFSPRDYVLENLTLEKSAQQYVNILRRYCQSGYLDPTLSQSH